MRNGKANHNVFCGMISAPVFSNLNLSMTAPAMKYVTKPPIALYIYIIIYIYIMCLFNYSCDPFMKSHLQND